MKYVYIYVDPSEENEVTVNFHMKLFWFSNIFLGRQFSPQICFLLVNVAYNLVFKITILTAFYKIELSDCTRG
jgi:hypothetical protein